MNHGVFTGNEWTAREAGNTSVLTTVILTDTISGAAAGGGGAAAADGDVMVAAAGGVAAAATAAAAADATAGDVGTTMSPELDCPICEATGAGSEVDTER